MALFLNTCLYRRVRNQTVVEPMVTTHVAASRHAAVLYRCMYVRLPRLLGCIVQTTGWCMQPAR